MEELPDDAVFDLDRFVPHLESCPACGSLYPEVLLLLGIEAPRRAAPTPTRKWASHRVAAGLLAATILFSVAAGLVTSEDTIATAPASHSAVASSTSNSESHPPTETGTRLPLNTTTLWTRVSYAQGDKARSTLKRRITRPNSRIRATVAR